MQSKPDPASIEPVCDDLRRSHQQSCSLELRGRPHALRYVTALIEGRSTPQAWVSRALAGKLPPTVPRSSGCSNESYQSEAASSATTAAAGESADLDDNLNMEGSDGDSASLSGSIRGLRF